MSETLAIHFACQIASMYVVLKRRGIQMKTTCQLHVSALLSDDETIRIITMFAGAHIFICGEYLLMVVFDCP